MRLTTARLVLREFDEADVPAVFSYQSDPRYLQHTPWTTRTEPEVREFVRMLAGWADERPRTRFQLAIAREDDVVIGTAGVRLAEASSREAEFGCELAPHAWGHGYGLEAGRAIVEFAFRTLGLHRIFAYTLAENAAAIVLAERLGMRREGRLRQNAWAQGRWTDTVIYGLLSDEWAPSPPSSA